MPPQPAARPPALALLAIIAVPVLFHLTIVCTSSTPLTLRLNLGALAKLGFVSAAALMHWGLYASLLATFGLTLRPGHEPLITGMARRLHGDIAAELVTYTRNVTIAWTVFFAMQLALSIGLFCFAPLVVWSFFVNILDIPLVVTMFAAEYAIRLRCLKHPPRHSLSMIFNMVADSVHEARARPAGPRN
jgi:uncharacterized membrane protein